MRTEISAVLEQTRFLAQERGWSHIGALAQSLNDNNAPTLLIAASTNVDVSPFCEWISRANGEANVLQVELETLANDPVPSLGVPRIVAVFECGKIIEVGAIEALSGVFYSRPSSSYAIVLSGADLVETPDELAAIERASWRVLVPDPKPDWAGQDLLGQNCFLWSEAEPHPFLRLRAQRDKVALSEWLQRPCADADLVLRGAALYVLDLAEEQMETRDGANGESHEDAALETQQLRSTLELLGDTRRHLMRRLDADASSLERQLTASLQTLEQNLLHELPAYLQNQVKLNKDADVRQVLSDFLAGRVSSWQSATRHLLSSREREISGEVGTLFEGVDWGLVNRIAEREGAAGAYPGLLLREMAMGDLSGSSSSNALQVVSEESNSPSFVRLALGAVLVVGVGAVLLGATGIIAGTVAAVVGTRKMNRQEDERRAEAYGRSAIRDVMGRAVTHVRDSSRQLIGPARDSLGRELRVVEELLSRALNQARALPDSAPRNPDRELLDELRARVLACG